MTAAVHTETANVRRTATRRKNAAAKKVAAAAAPAPVATKKAKAAKLDTTGIYKNKANGKFEITVFWGSYQTVEEAAKARAYALQAKATYKAEQAD